MESVKDHCAKRSRNGKCLLSFQFLLGGGKNANLGYKQCNESACTHTFAPRTSIRQGLVKKGQYAMNLE